MTRHLCLAFGLLLALSGCSDDVGTEAVDGVDAPDDEGVSADSAADADSDEAETTPDANEDAFVEDPTAIQVRFDPGAEDFFRMPWPSDARVLEDGTVDLRDFPNANQPTLQPFRRAIEGTIRGFSTMPVVYVAVEDAPETLTLPSPSATIRAGSLIQLFDVTEEGCGQRVPVIATFESEGDRYIDPGVIAATPVPGFVLRPNTTYALIVRRELGFEEGRSTARPAGFEAALADAASPIGASLAPLTSCLERDTLNLSDIAVATVFTTQDPIGELASVRAHAVSADHATPPAVQELALVDEISDDAFATWAGFYDTPIYQEGTSPYAAEGEGTFRFDADGNPEVVRFERVPITITAKPGGAGNRPVLIWTGGTGTGQFSHVGRRFTRGAVDEGFVVVSFLPQFHGSRATPNSDPIVHGFNYLNPSSGRTVFRQQVVDTSYLVRLIREAWPGADRLPTVDPERIVYGGHSQGAIVGALAAAVEPDISAWLLNGIGGYTSVTIVERVDPFDIQALLREIFEVGRDLTVTHPIVQLAQLGVEVTDPQNHALYWNDAGDGDGAHVFMLNGALDETTFERSMNTLVIAAEAPPLNPPGWDVDPYDVWDGDAVAAPITANRRSATGSPLTMGTYLDAEQGHFTLYRLDAAADAAVRFWSETAAGRVPEIELR